MTSAPLLPLWSIAAPFIGWLLLERRCLDGQSARSRPRDSSCARRRAKGAGRHYHRRVVLLPEGLAALRAAHANRLQTSLNLALGSALASIGLTIPAVAIVSLVTGWTLTLGLDNKATVLLLLSLFVTTVSLGTGRTTVLQGTVHLVIFAVYLFTTVVP